LFPYQSTHNTGGLIMGTNPRDSAVNTYLQSWTATIFLSWRMRISAQCSVQSDRSGRRARLPCCRHAQEPISEKSQDAGFGVSRKSSPARRAAVALCHFFEEFSWTNRFDAREIHARARDCRQSGNARWHARALGVRLISVSRKKIVGKLPITSMCI